MGRCSFRLKGAFCSLLLALLSGGGWAQSPEDVIARVNGAEVITRAELDTAVYVVARQRFYHGRMDDQRLQALRAEMLGSLIDRVLLLEEARARGVKAPAALEERLYRQLRRGYNVEAMPADHRREIEKELRRRAAEQALLEAVESEVRSVGKPTQRDLELFYRQNLDKFTTPPRLRLSVILLKVAPSAPVQAWQAAEEEGRQLRRKIEAGADFAELARLRSGDSSAEAGGDLGFVHEGMLSLEAQQAIDTLAVGAVSAPVVLLQGVALFRVEQRQEAKVNPLEQVRGRAQGLWRRDRADQAWQGLLQSLRAKADIEIINSEITATMIWTQKTDVVQ